MVWSTVSEPIKWRYVISKFDGHGYPKSISLALGDWVYVEKQCDGWFFGFKSSKSNECGIFPISCTSILFDEELSRIYAEKMSLLPAVQQLFKTGDDKRFQCAASCLLDMTSQHFESGSSSTHESQKKCIDSITKYLSICERQLNFPLQTRVPTILECVSVDLQSIHKNRVKEDRNGTLASQSLLKTPFNIAIEFGHLPPHQVTVYLASQSLQITDISATNSMNAGENETTYSRSLNYGDLFSRTCFDGLSVKVNDFQRITENATLDLSSCDTLNTVVFSELSPFDPCKMRIMLVINTSRVGALHSKKCKTPLRNTGNAAIELIRCPQCVACVDITKDLIPIVLPFRTNILSATERLKKRTAHPVSVSRIVNLINSGEQSQYKFSEMRANETPSSLLESLQPASQSRGGGDSSDASSALPPMHPSTLLLTATTAASTGGDFSNTEWLEIKDIRPVIVHSHHLLHQTYPDSILARPYSTKRNTLTSTMRNDLFVTLISSDFEKSIRKQDYNLEVEVSLLNKNGQPVSWSSGSNCGEAINYFSNVYPSRSQSHWNELIRIQLPSVEDESEKENGVGVGDYERCENNRSRINSVLEESSTDLDDEKQPSALPSPLLAMDVHLRFVIRHRSTASVCESGDRSGSHRKSWYRSASPSRIIRSNSVVVATEEQISGSYWQRWFRSPSSSRASTLTVQELKERVLGVAYLPLQLRPGNQFVQNGDFSLLIYKMDEKGINECRYLNEKSYDLDVLSSSSGSSLGNGLAQGGSSGHFFSVASGIGSSSRVVKNQTLNIRTVLCSNQYTTDEYLAKVLTWKQNDEEVIMCLKKLASIPDQEGEIKKFTMQLVDCLLQMLSTVSYPQDPFSTNADVNEQHTLLGVTVVTMLNRIYKDIQNNFEACELLDAYIEGPAFRHLSIHLPYMSIVNVLLFKHLSAEHIFAYLDGNYKMDYIMSNFTWMFKIVVRSKELESEHLTERQRIYGNGIFISFVDCFLERISKVVAEGQNLLITGHILKHIAEVIDPLMRVYPIDKLALWLEDLIGCSSSLVHLGNQSLLRGVLHSIIFENIGFRQRVLPFIVDNLKIPFSKHLTEALKPSRQEVNQIMDYVFDILLLFVSRFIKVVKLSSACPALLDTNPPESSPIYTNHQDDEPQRPLTSEEFIELFIRRGFLRWVMQEYGRVLNFLNSTASSRPSSEQLSFGSQFSPVSHIRIDTVRYLHLQSVLSGLATVLTSILQQLNQPSDWLLFVPVRLKHRGCNVCSSLELTDCSDFLNELLTIFHLSHTWPAYPSVQPGNVPSDSAVAPYSSPCKAFYLENEQPWAEMLALQSKVELESMENMFNFILKDFFMSNSTNRQSDSLPHLSQTHVRSMQLIISMQVCLGSFVTSQLHLRLEELPTISHVVTAPRCPDGTLGDLRVSASCLLERVWHAIGDFHKPQFIQYFMPTVIEMATVAVPELRSRCVNLVIDMIEHPSAAEALLVREVDDVMQWADAEFAQDMIHRLEIHLSQFEGSSSLLPPVDYASATDSLRIRRASPVPQQPSSYLPSLMLKSQRVIECLIKQFKCLQEYRDYINRPSKLSGMLAISNLMTFYESILCKDVTMRYLYRLAELHDQCNNDVEMGYTLERISEQYNWSSERVDLSEVSPHYARQMAAMSASHPTSSQVREFLLMGSLKSLEDGGDWEQAVEVCDQLVHYYKNVKVDYDNLATILDRQSQLYTKIVSDTPRVTYNYYVLQFSSVGFPSFIFANCVSRTTSDAASQLASFVYRTSKPNFDVIKLLEDQFPEARVLRSVGDCSNVDCDTPTIRVFTNLQPVLELPRKWATVENLSNRIRAYYTMNQAKEFVRMDYFRQQKGTDEGRETRYILNSTLPNYLPFMPVIAETSRNLSEIELALGHVQTMSRRLGENIHVVEKAGDQASTYLATMVQILSTSISSPVSGGIIGLLAGVNLADDSIDEKQVQLLSDAVLDILKKQLFGLELWRSLTPSNQSPDNLFSLTCEQYDALKRDMSIRFGFSVDHLVLSPLFSQPFNSCEQPIRAFVRSDGAASLQPPISGPRIRKYSIQNPNFCNTQLFNDCTSTQKRSKSDVNGSLNLPPVIPQRHILPQTISTSFSRRSLETFSTLPTPTNGARSICDSPESMPPMVPRQFSQRRLPPPPPCDVDEPLSSPTLPPRPLKPFNGCDAPPIASNQAP